MALGYVAWDWTPGISYRASSSCWNHLRLASFRPWEPGHLGAGHRHGQRVSPVLHAETHVVKVGELAGLGQLLDPAVMPQREHPVVQGRVVGCRDARLDARDRLARLQAEAPDVTQRPDLPAVPGRAMGVGRVLDQLDVGPVHDVEEPVHVGGVAVGVGDDDGARLRRDSRPDVGRVRTVGVGVHVAEYRRRAAVKDG